MSEHFISKSTPELDGLILSAQSLEEIREAAKNHLAAAGILHRERGEGIGERVIEQESPMSQQQPAPAVSMPAMESASQTHIRVVYPWKNDRFELYGASEKELDQKEAAIRAMYRGRQ